MRKTLLAIGVVGMLGLIGTVLAEGMQPDDAVALNLANNPAFEYCNSTAISNGVVVFGGESAINTPGEGGTSSSGDSAVTTQGTPSYDCGLTEDSQRVEPASWWD